MKKDTILAHVCCAPDALYVLHILQERYDVTGFFYNPNISPEDEYSLRLEEAKKAADILDLRLIEGPYDSAEWHRLTQKFKTEPEKGKRCDICYAMRISRTAQTAAREGFDVFTTVMSLSPWKKADVMNKMGGMFAKKYKIKFLEEDFKKKDGFKKSTELSKRYGLYRQNYCGCLYSRR
jgi:predicted adenine nucleotide alpha hydrolase (AANH) superfamily ATPase